MAETFGKVNRRISQLGNQMTCQSDDFGSGFEGIQITRFPDCRMTSPQDRVSSAWKAFSSSVGTPKRLASSYFEPGSVPTTT